MSIKPNNLHPHQETPVLRMGSDIHNASSALIFLHGRGGSAEDMLGLARAFSLPEGMIVLAPQASSHSWYPQRLIAPVASNEPYLTSALRRIDEEVETLQKNGVPTEHIIIGGFSQGASLAIEYLLRQNGRWGGLLAFSGGFIWPLGQERQPAGSLHDTPVYLGCSDADPYIPLARVEETSAILQAMGARVTIDIFPGMGHTIIQEEIDAAQKIISAL